MLKALLLVIFHICVLCVVLTQADITAPIEWKDGKKKRWRNKDRFDGSCQFTMDKTYDAGDVNLNVIFDGQVDKFYTPKNWRSTGGSSGNSYNCNSKQKIERGKQVDIKFKVKTKKSKGPIRTLVEKIIKGTVGWFKKFVKKDNGASGKKNDKSQSNTGPPDGMCALSFINEPTTSSTSTTTTSTPTPKPTTTSTTPTAITTSTTPTVTSTTPTTTPTVTSTTPTVTSTTPTTTPTVTSTTPTVTSTTSTITSTTPTVTSTTPTVTSTTPTVTSTTPTITTTTPTVTSTTPTVTSTTPTVTSTTPTVTSTTPTVTSTTPNPTTTIQVPTITEQDCGITVEYGNNKWLNQGKNFTRGQCDFSFDAFVQTGAFQVNVTFDSIISTYSDYNTMTLVSSDPGNWYFSESKFPFNPNQDFMYAFEISWLTGDFPPAKCYSNLEC